LTQKKNHHHVMDFSLEYKELVVAGTLGDNNSGVSTAGTGSIAAGTGAGAGAGADSMSATASVFCERDRR
jgi:hypothetical protein